MKADIHFTTECHPEANGRKPEIGDVAWNVYMPLDDGNTLHIHMGKKGRDLLFGMLIADCHDSGEDEPNALATEPKIQTSNDKQWREYYEQKCRAGRKEIAALSDACMKALEVFQGKRYKAGVPELLFKTLLEWGYVYED